MFNWRNYILGEISLLHYIGLTESGPAAFDTFKFERSLASLILEHYVRGYVINMLYTSTPPLYSILDLITEISQLHISLSSTGSILSNTDLSDLSTVGTCDIFVYQMHHRVM